jgi:hypothetical protein
MKALGVLMAAVLALLVGGCAGTHRASPRARAAADRAACPVTKPGGPRPPRYALLNFGDPMTRPSDPSLYGNGTLWVGIPKANWAIRDPRTGMVGMKVGWFRARRGVVTVTGRPWHGAPAAFRADVGTPQEYGATGFAASGLEFAHTGCWELRARLAGRVLRVVLEVRVSRAS